MIYVFDGTMTGLLSCVFRAFSFKQFDVRITQDANSQNGLFDEMIIVPSNNQHAQRVWTALKRKVSSNSLRHFYYSFLSEQDPAFNHMFGFACYVFQKQYRVDQDYGHVDVLGISQWAKQVGREKHRMEAFVRFKK